MAKTKTEDTTGTMELTNEQIRQAAQGVALLLQERLPSDVGIELQTRKQLLRFALVAPNEEHDRLVMQYCKRDKKKNPVMAEGGTGYEIAPAYIETWAHQSRALWSSTQRLRLTPIPRKLIPEKVEGKPLVVPGVVWEFLAPILAD